MLRRGGVRLLFVAIATLINISDAFALFYNAKAKKVYALNGSGRSPKSLNLRYLKDRGVTGRSIPFTDINSVTVPGRHSTLP